MNETNFKLFYSVMTVRVKNKCV